MKGVAMDEIDERWECRRGRGRENRLARAKPLNSKLPAGAAMTLGEEAWFQGLKALHFYGLQAYHNQQSREMGMTTGFHGGSLNRDLLSFV